MERKEDVTIRREVYVGNKYHADGYLEKMPGKRELSFLPGVRDRIIFEFLVRILPPDVLPFMQLYCYRGISTTPAPFITPIQQFSTLLEI